jgi:hypothetical protein
VGFGGLAAAHVGRRRLAETTALKTRHPAAPCLTVASGYLATGGGRTLPASAIDDVTTRITMQAGARPYYDIVVTTKEGKKITAGRAVRDKREAEWLAATIKQALGRK